MDEEFLAERAGGDREAFPHLAAILREQLDAGRRAWPGVALAPEVFARHVARRLPAGAGEDDLRTLRAADLYLACACAAGDPAAIEAFERAYLGEVDLAGARTRADATLVGEVKQHLRRILFVAEPGRAAAAAEFNGRGELRGWVRVSATRELIHLMKRQKREVAVDDAAFLDYLAPAQDVELALLKERYRGELAAAVRAALAALSDEDRSLLRYQVLDGLSIDDIGAIYGIHRATAARRLARAREGILERTREELSLRLGASRDEVDSIVRLVHSRLDVSLERVLR